MSGRSWNEWANGLLRDVASVMAEEVLPYVKSLQQEVIEDVVYAVYAPKMYVRRYENGGLLDERLMEGRVVHTPGEMLMEEVLLTLSHGVKGQDDRSLALALLVEYGHDQGYGSYTYVSKSKQARYLRPRPFTRKTQEMLAFSGVQGELMREGLMKAGYQLK